MKRLTKWQMWLMLAGVLAAVLLLGIWLFGWGRGNINVIPFSAEEVDHVWLACDPHCFDGRATVTDPEAIQALINEANTLQHTGSELKTLFQYGFGAGGSSLHTLVFFLTSGETYTVTFASNHGGQPVTDMALSYWVTLSNGNHLTAFTCRGSLELSYELHKTYCRPVPDPFLLPSLAN